MEFIEYLVSELSNNLCVPFIGAGFSKNAISTQKKNIPLWSDLIDTMCKKLNFVNSKLTTNDYQDIAEKFEERFTRLKLIELCMEQIQDLEYEPGYVHYLLSTLGFKRIITTNYDSIIERAYRKNGRTIQRITTKQQLAVYEASQQTCIIKMHGDFDSIEKLIITKSDYDNFFKNNEFIADYIKGIFRTKTLLFMGYSLNDPDFKQIINYRNRLSEFTKRIFIVDFNPDNTEISTSLDKAHNTCFIQLGIRDRSHEMAIIYFLRELINLTQIKSLMSTKINDGNVVLKIPSNIEKFNPATDEEIQQFERKIGSRLPQSYKEFLKITNGCKIILNNEFYLVYGIDEEQDYIIRFKSEKFQFKRYHPIHCKLMSTEWEVYYCIDLHGYYNKNECPIVRVDAFNNKIELIEREKYSNFVQFLREKSRNLFPFKKV